MSLKFSEKDSESTFNLIFSAQNHTNNVSTSDLDTGRVNDGCDISMEVMYEKDCKSFKVQIEPQHDDEGDDDENEQSSDERASADRSVEFAEPKPVNRCSNKLHRPSKWKHVGRIFPMLGYWGKTNSRSENVWSKTLNRIGHYNTQILDAIEKHNNNEVERILKAGANSNATCRLNHVSACHAAAYSNSDALRLLLDYGATRDRRDKYGRTPLHFAAWAGSTSTMALLLGFTNDLQHKIMFQVTPEAEEEIKAFRPQLTFVVDVPCKQSNVKNLRQMWKDRIEHKCNRFMKHIPKFFPGWTALHIASYAAHHDATRLLLAAGANPNAKDAMGQTPLDVAGAACYLDSNKVHVDEYVKTIKTLLEFGGKLNESDTSTHSALHTAVELCCVEATQVLLEAGALISQKNYKGYSPLHGCVAKRSEEILHVLLSNNQPVDVLDNSGHTVLQTAILASWIPGVCIILDAGASVIFEAHDGKTAIHIAALNGNLDILNEILRNAAQYPDAVNHYNGRAEPPIFCAIRSGNIECLQAFLDAKATLRMYYYIEPIYGVPVIINSGLEQSSSNIILHATAEVGNESMLKLLLQHDQNLEELLYCKYPHLGNMIPVEFAAFHNKFDSFRFLLQKTLEVMLRMQITFDHSRLLHIINKKEKAYFEEFIKQIPNALKTGNTSKYYYPLHDAAKNSNRNRIVHLIDNGADLSEIDKDGNTAIRLIIDNVSKPTEFLAKILDEYIKIDTACMSSECEITVDYRVLIPSTDGSLDENDQLRVVTALLKTKDRENQRKLLAHPLVESFLYLKWKNLSAYFYLMVALYYIFAMSLSVHTVSVFYYKDKYNDTMLENGIVPRVWSSPSWIYIIYFTLGFVAIQELSCVNLSPKTWTVNILTIEFWVKLITYILAIATPLVISVKHDVDVGPLDWKRQMATVALVMAWFNVMIIISKIPMSGKFIEMFWMVLIKVIEIYMTFSFLILMFSFCFMIQFHSKAPFEGPWAAVAKTLVMMTSEFDYDDTFTRKKANDLSTSIQILRVVFVIFLVVTAIVLMNLMIGVAVNDVQSLVQIGNIKRLEKQVDFLNKLEISRRRNKSIFHFLGIHRWFKCSAVPQTVTFKPINNYKCKYSSIIKEAIINKVQEQIDKKEREAEWNKIESKLINLSQDLLKAFEKVSDRLEMKTAALSNDVLRHLYELNSKIEYVQNSKN